jgi:hypothetical protein
MWYYIAPGAILGLIAGILIVYYCDDDYDKKESSKKRAARRIDNRAIDRYISEIEKQGEADINFSSVYDETEVTLVRKKIMLRLKERPEELRSYSELRLLSALDEQLVRIREVHTAQNKRESDFWMAFLKFVVVPALTMVGGVFYYNLVLV